MDDKNLERDDLEEFSLDDIYGTDFFKDLELQIADLPAEQTEEFTELTSEELDVILGLTAEKQEDASEDFDFITHDEALEDISQPESELSQQMEFDLEERLNQTAEEPLVKVKRRRPKMTWQRSLLTYVHDLVFLLATIIVIFLLVFRVVVVSGQSMNDTLYDGDYLLLLSNVFYRNPKQGDIIVASKESFKDGAPIVKRIIATEGQVIDIDFEAGIVYVGEDLEHLEPLDEPYTKTLTTREEGMEFPQTVPDGCVFVMGDNRDDSKDSRDTDIGFVKKEEIMGKVIFLFFPGTNYGQHAQDFSRIGAVS